MKEYGLFQELSNVVLLEGKVDKACQEAGVERCRDHVLDM